MDCQDVSADGVAGCRSDGSGSGGSSSSGNARLSADDFVVELHPELAAARRHTKSPAIEPLYPADSHEAEVNQSVQGSIAACRSEVHFDPE